MKKIALKILEGIALCFALIYLTPVSLNVFNHLIGLLPVEFIIYKPLTIMGFVQVAVWSSLGIALVAIVLEWNREKRRVSYLIFIAYLSAPFVASLILFLITGWRIGQIDPMFLERMGGQVSIEIIPMRLIFVGYILFPIAHLTINRIKGRSSRGDQLRYGSTSTA